MVATRSRSPKPGGGSDAPPTDASSPMLDVSPRSRSVSPTVPWDDPVLMVAERRRAILRSILHLEWELSGLRAELRAMEHQAEETQATAKKAETADVIH